MAPGLEPGAPLAGVQGARCETPALVQRFGNLSRAWCAGGEFCSAASFFSPNPSRRVLRLNYLASATVHGRPTWGQDGRAFGKFCKSGHFWRFQSSRSTFAGAVFAALYALHFTVLYTLHYALHTLHFTLHILPCTLYTLHFTLRTLHSTIKHSTLSTLYTVYTLHSTLYTLHLTLHTAHFKLSTPKLTLYTFHSVLRTWEVTLYTPHSTLWTLPCTLHTLPLHFTL